MLRGNAEPVGSRPRLRNAQNSPVCRRAWSFTPIRGPSLSPLSFETGKSPWRISLEILNMTPLQLVRPSLGSVC